eukprot:3454035-Rhodomonas_salina.3
MRLEMIDDGFTHPTELWLVGCKRTYWRRLANSGRIQTHHKRQRPQQWGKQWCEHWWHVALNVHLASKTTSRSLAVVPNKGAQFPKMTIGMVPRGARCLVQHRARATAYVLSYM